MNERLIKMLAEGYVSVAQLRISNMKKQECFYLPSIFRRKFKTAYLLEKDGKVCLITEDV